MWPPTSSVRIRRSLPRAPSRPTTASGSSTFSSPGAAASAPAPRRFSAISSASACSACPRTEARMTIRSVPIIDVAPFLSGSLEDKRRVAGEVGRACEEMGFLIVKGHGMPRELIDQMYDVSKRFFELPLDEKMQTHGRERSRGYGPLGEEALSYGLGKAAPADGKEGLSKGPMEVRDT